MPPKKNQQKAEESSDQPKTIEKQTKLFEKNISEEDIKCSKSRSKQFNASSTDKS
jgi:hypothetical protein